MIQQAVVNRNGMVVGETAIQDLKAILGGELLRPSDDGYDTARKIWNGMIDKRPGFIVRCSGVADVISAVHFARSYSGAG